jgi:tetratricopeptide (TPR) repeat protein
VATSLDNLAVVYAMLKNYPQAEKLYQQALRIRDGEDASSLHNLALVEEGLKKDTEADGLYKRMVGMPLKDPGPPLLEYAELLRKMHRPVEAAKMELRAKTPPDKPKQ